jgi:tetratricopeptide (TPR) repeat protein
MVTFVAKIKHVAAETGSRPWPVQMALVLLAGIAAYWNSLQVPFVMDDAAISFLGPKNPLDILLHGTARRVVDVTFALNYRLHGLQVTGYHLVNLAIHLAAALTLYFLVISAMAALRHSFSTGEEDPLAGRFVPLAAALLFALHPLQTQAVTYTIQRYTCLATLFYLLTALLFVRARLAYDRHGAGTGTLLLAGGALTAAVLALGSKQIAATLPLMLVVLEIFLFRGRLINRRFFATCGALSLLAALALLATWGGGSLRDAVFDLHHATSEDNITSRSAYLLTQARVVAVYLRLLILPWGQSVFHDVAVSTSLLSLPVLAALALHGAIIAGAIILFRQSARKLPAGDTSRGELQRLAALGIAWFYVAMIVESSLFPITDIIFEHRVYLPSAGFFLTIAAGIAGLVRNRKAAWGLLTIICLALGGLTVARNRVWNDSLILWQDTTRKAPGRYLAWANLAGEYLARNRPDLAVPAYVRAIELNPGLHVSIQSRLGEALQRLQIYDGRFTTGQEYLRPGPSEGVGGQDYRNMGKLGSVLFNNLGLAHEYLREPEKARKSYREALWATPDYDLAWYNLGLLALSVGDGGQAATVLRELQRLNPELAKNLEDSMGR